MTINDAVSQKIKKAREAAGVSQAKVARRCGWSQSYYWNVENGRVRISVEMACQVARALEVKVVEWLPEDCR